MANLYRIGLSLDDVSALVDKGVAKAQEVKSDLKAQIKAEAAAGARQAVMPLVIGSSLLSVLGLIVSLSRR